MSDRASMLTPAGVLPSAGIEEYSPLIAHHTFILATRNTGYRNVSAAIAELIDNALQAGARTVHITVREERTSLGAADAAKTPADERVTSASRPESSRSRRITIAVLDDGVGMDANALRTALQFGGSTRFDDRTGAGRFGMGLPNSSVSQARRLEVYTWQGGATPLFSYLDVDEIAQGRLIGVPMPTARSLPDWAIGSTGDSGTLVVWPACDRLPYRKAATVRLKLRDALGRLYRYAIRSGICITIDRDRVEPLDPLLQDVPDVAPGSAEPFGDELRYEIKVPTDPARTSTVCVRFSLLPVASWARLPLEDKRRLGVLGGAGVSVVRAGREIDYGWYFMGAKRRENYDDWWRCEVRFEPALDEYFGVTHSKQGVTPHPRLLEFLTPDMEHVARTLNARVRGEFVRLALGRAAAGGHHRDDRHHSAARDEVACGESTVRAALREQLLPPLPRRVRRYRITADALPGGHFYDAQLAGDTIVLTLNSNHPFYERLYLPACEAGGAERYRVECLLLAAARGEIAADASIAADQRAPGTYREDAAPAEDAVRRALRHQREAWSDALAAFLSGH